MYIYSDTAANLLYVETSDKCHCFEVRDQDGKQVICPVLYTMETQNGHKTALDASNLALWTLSAPALYWISDGTEVVRFGHTSLQTFQASAILFNNSPIYLRGYIRGIVAHDHPNMTGDSDYAAARKNIMQAKKYGFNLVRFHSTIPSEDFVRAADELGLLIHMEIGYAYEMDSCGNKHVSTNNAAWTDTILQYRNHPSVAIFCIGNEMHNAGHFQEVHALYEDGKRLAPNKLIMDNSGWGEFDRTSADIFSQHIAYFFPYKQHRDMFISDDPWIINGSISDAPLNTTIQSSTLSASIHRYANPIRPTISHEAVHYIDIPDYEALSRKYNAFAARVGQAYLEAHHITRPKYMTEIPALIERKHLQSYMPDYYTGSQKFKELATKLFLERLRLSPLCGFEMLQLSDCLKYENKNGIIDCFDDDKNVDAAQFRQFNSDLVLLKDQRKETYFEDEDIDFTIYASNFDPNPEIRGNLSVFADGELVYSGKSYVLASGLHKLVSVHLHFSACGVACRREIKAIFTCHEKTVENHWNIWTYPYPHMDKKPTYGSLSPEIRAFLNKGTRRSSLFVTDTFDETVFSHLDAGNNVLLLYRYGEIRNKWQLPGAMERFKPCIWDRGSNLGGFIRSESLCKMLAVERYFDLNMQKLLEAGSKINLDHFPCAVNEIICGIDKPVRDRMQGLVTGDKRFTDDVILRRFSHLFSLRVGNGSLIVCTLNVDDPADPVVQNLLAALVDRTELFIDNSCMNAEAFRGWLEKINASAFKTEDIMNHFWELDNKPVEDTLFWEEAGIDLAKLV